MSVTVILRCEGRSCPYRFRTSTPPADGKWRCPNHQGETDYPPNTDQKEPKDD